MYVTTGVQPVPVQQALAGVQLVPRAQAVPASGVQAAMQESPASVCTHASPAGQSGVDCEEHEHERTTNTSAASLAFIACLHLANDRRTTSMVVLVLAARSTRP